MTIYTKKNPNGIDETRIIRPVEEPEYLPPKRAEVRHSRFAHMTMLKGRLQEAKQDLASVAKARFEELQKYKEICGMLKSVLTDEEYDLVMLLRDSYHRGISLRTQQECLENEISFLKSDVFRQ